MRWFGVTVSRNDSDCQGHFCEIILLEPTPKEPVIPRSEDKVFQATGGNQKFLEAEHD